MKSRGNVCNTHCLLTPATHATNGCATHIHTVGTTTTTATTVLLGRMQYKNVHVVLVIQHVCYMKVEHVCHCVKVI